MSLARSASSFMPSTRSARSSRSLTGARAGSFAAASLTGPGSPPQISMTSCVARSSARRVSPKSTPRSNRNDESEPNPSARDFPAIASGEKNALSRNTSRVASLTAVDEPPMMPASATAFSSSAITR